ncbi:MULTISPECIES: hypothetical protein [Pseudonocardia]|uniref:Uncharacterized protein n=2 Tax=Pseudonocardia TaxID=1847 RepID=A0A1Y2MJ97_PSEAH|nr:MULTISPECIES: hypothetical protein [Pseudonocardia]OSY35345.1 hypothetical protein BG845_06106 [Pseudonocardia autotrophica]TDN75489.1 hypothetical protein C8E95_4658 [Pseudonocardia autotrophica]BBF99455.1 hypothetical protein Pdca_06650 [Pseudonocardia autotrophica]GEC29313.1 hypothetical protein PSA01_63420 [Pseudonocardia saturnea]
MDGTRTRLVALAGPLALGVVLGIAALLESPSDRPAVAIPESADSRPATTAATAASAPAMLGLPPTTPRSEPAREASANPAPAPAPAPAPEPAHTASGH